MTEEKQKKAQDMYMEFQALDQHIKQLQSQLEMITRQLFELRSTASALEELKAVKEGKEIFVPLSSGIFAKAAIKDTSELLVNVGANVVVQQDIAYAKKLIMSQVEEVGKVQKQMIENLEKTANRAAHLEMELQKIVG
ncbi:prefoldin subunit alpha [Candidatus Woesearchaeota archaeon]|nr:prefoldin subunit alpha [Candidatus Woesearchaeota archaeon]